jgi:hypothetical protein
VFPPPPARWGWREIVSKQLGSRYRSGRSPDWPEFKNLNAPAVKSEPEADWGRRCVGNENGRLVSRNGGDWRSFNIMFRFIGIDDRGQSTNFQSEHVPGDG